MLPKFDGNEGGVWKFLLEKSGGMGGGRVGGGQAKWVGLSRNGGVAILHWGFSGDSSFDSVDSCNSFIKYSC